MISVKINEIANNFFLNGYKLISKLHLRRLGFTYSTCGPFTKHLAKIQISKETGGLNYIHKSELDKPRFSRDAAYANCKDLNEITVPDNILKDRAMQLI